MVDDAEGNIEQLMSKKNTHKYDPPSLFKPISPDLVKQGLVADVEEAGRFFSVPSRLFEGSANGFDFGFTFQVANQGL